MPYGEAGADDLVSPYRKNRPYALDAFGCVPRLCRSPGCRLGPVHTARYLAILVELRHGVPARWAPLERHCCSVQRVGESRGPGGETCGETCYEKRTVTCPPDPALVLRKLVT